MIVKALNENTSNLSTENSEKSQISYEDVVSNYVKKAYEDVVKSYKAEQSTTAESSKPLSKYPSSANYNAENAQLMDRMLFEAFQHLRKNPKFVWAQLPDAHKVPFLREWIAHRFGKEYTPTERAKSYKRSCLVFRALDKNNLKLAIPNSNNI
ncbi:hypothetical protein EVAR_72015_1, partial [Eumeta japonica]